jgi:beta-lactamase class A
VPLYERTQVGWVTALAVLPGVVTGIVVSRRGVDFGWMVAAIALVLLLLFGALTVRLTEDSLLVRFGIGLIRRRIPIRDIMACRPVRNPWYYGWGIRMIPGGVLYSVSGLSAVELTLANGLLLRIGSDEPAALAAAIAGQLPVIATAGPGAAPSARVPMGVRAAVALLIVVVGGIAGTVMWSGERPVQASISNGIFDVGGAAYHARVPLAAMTSVTLADAIPAVRRKVNGYDFGNTLRGHFRLEEFGDSDLFINRSAPPFIVVRSAGGALVVNLRTADLTRRLYADLVAQRATPQSVRADIEQLIRASGAEVAVVWRPLDAASGEALLINETMRFHAASTMKVPVMIELFRRVDAKQLALSDTVVVTNQFHSIVDGSPYVLSATVDSDGDTYKAIGRPMTLSALCEAMITVSSNLAANVLIEKLGAREIQATVDRLGASGMQVLRGVEDQKAFDKGLNNTTDAAGLARLFEHIGRGEAVSRAASAAMIEILRRQSFNDGIPAGVPAGTAVAHKTGTITAVHHDAGIVYAKRPYVLVVLTRGLPEEKQSDALIASISRAVFPLAARQP